MALTEKKILLLIELIFCCCTNYFILDMKYDDLYIWKDAEQYTLDNIKEMIEQKIVFFWIIFTLLTFLIWYWLIPMMLELIAFRLVLPKYQKLISKINDQEHFNKFVSINSIRKIKKLYKTENIHKITQEEHNQNIDKSFTYFSVFIHFVICWNLLEINNNIYMIIIFSICIIVWIISLLLLLPATKIFNIYTPK
ncbi:MAG: hypothetical protein IT232_00415 [Flavobacteriales bacterium]|nr:hypothetical protein [Flavobacteriales bacterium]